MPPRCWPPPGCWKDASAVAIAVAPDVAAAGGTYVEVAMDKACVDGNLVTGPAWPAHPAWLAAFLEVLGTRIVPVETEAARQKVSA